jgi:hypothetical protein
MSFQSRTGWAIKSEGESRTGYALAAELQLCWGDGTNGPFERFQEDVRPVERLPIGLNRKPLYILVLSQIRDASLHPVRWKLL